MPNYLQGFLSMPTWYNVITPVIAIGFVAWCVSKDKRFRNSVKDKVIGIGRYASIVRQR